MDYKDENMRLMLGDCLERMKEIPDGSVDLTVTSPPYDNLRTYNGNNDQWGEHVWKKVLEELHRVTAGGGVVVWVVGDAESIKGAAEKLVSKTYYIGETVSERAAFIARDQTSKLTSATNIARMKSAGIKKVRWRHSGGSYNPRKLHLGYDGQIFDLDNPPIIEEDGTRGWVGETYNCRCYLVPIIDFG